ASHEQHRRQCQGASCEALVAACQDRHPEQEQGTVEHPPAEPEVHLGGCCLGLQALGPCDVRLLAHPLAPSPTAPLRKRETPAIPSGTWSRASSPALGRACSRPGALAISAKTAFGVPPPPLGRTDWYPRLEMAVP